ncbi:DUF962 domain-containing protein [Shewanella sp. YIC-542]|uniref:Mpo1 family 2-hydroxy fatty acid dioxygenase n=1 Tax=Shewanella mytili TaxID=3377111 RepID=UPI00398EF15C
MKTAQEQLSCYKSVHLNPVNLTTHFVGIPLIIWSLFLLASFIRLPWGAGSIGGGAYLLLPLMCYYLWLHWRLAIGMGLFMAMLLLGAEWLYRSDNASLWLALSVFGCGWLFQFVGHYHEKAKPAFIDDLQQLFIGPLFLMAEIYFCLGWLAPLRQQITPLALQKRRQLEQQRQGT